MLQLLFLLYTVTAAAPAAVPADEVFGNVRNAYRAGPVSDRIAVVASRRGELRVQFGPDGSLAMWMGPLRVSATGGVLTIVSDQNPARCVQRSYGQGMLLDELRRALPPLDLPQLHLALGEASPESVMGDRVGAVQWSDGVRGVTDAGEVIVLAGAGETAGVTVEVDAATWRLRRVEVSPYATPQATAEFLSSPIEPEPPSVWRIDCAGRTVVADLAALASTPAPIELGAQAPEILLLTLDSVPWRLSERSRAPLALLFFRENGSDALTGFRALERWLVTDDAPSGAAVRAAAVVRIEAGDGFEGVLAMTEQWGDDLLWTVAPELTMDLFAPSAGAAIVLLDSANTLLGVVRLDGREADVQPIIDEVRRAFAGVSPRPGPAGTAPGGAARSPDQS